MIGGEFRVTVMFVASRVGGWKSTRCRAGEICWRSCSIQYCASYRVLASLEFSPKEFPLAKFALKPMLSAIWRLEMTQRSICLPAAEIGGKSAPQTPASI